MAEVNGIVATAATTAVIVESFMMCVCGVAQRISELCLYRTLSERRSSFGAVGKWALE